MKTIDVEIAVMEYLGIRQNLIVPNVSWGIAGLHECDLLSLSTSNYATEIEIKVSKGDLLKDGEKVHGHVHDHITMLFFAVPEKLKEIALECIPERSGLFVIGTHELKYEWQKGLPIHYVSLERQAVRNKSGAKWSDRERNDLARLGAMRILGLKKKIALK